MNDRERFELLCHENNILIHFVGDLSTRIKDIVTMMEDIIL